MVKNLCYSALMTAILAVCQLTQVTTTIPLTPEPSQESMPNTSQATIPSTQSLLPLSTTSSPTAASSLTPIPTSAPRATAYLVIQPVIHEQPGDIYETVFSVPAGDNKIFHYLRTPTSIQGPNAIAILSDESILIADFPGNRLHHFAPTGRLLNTIQLGNLGIENVIDLRVKASEIFLLEISYHRYYVHHLSLDGTLISSDEIPHHFPIDAKEKDLTLENGLTGIAIDCNGNVILEVAGGSSLLPLSEVQRRSSFDSITQGYSCDGKRYQVISTNPFQIPQISAGNVIYETRLTHGLGGLSFLDVLPDGGFYLVRSDVLGDPIFGVDTSVHYVGTDGTVRGAARVPNSEFYIYPNRIMAISSKGEVFVLLPRLHSVDILRLNFYSQIEPLVPGAAIPQITILKNP